MYNFESMRFNSRGNVEDVLDKMKRIAENYGVVLVDDYKELCDVESNYMDTKYGWFQHMVEDAVIRRDYCGYFIDLPRPILIPDAQNDTPKYRPFTCKTSTDPQPIHITIHTNEISDLNETLAETFKYIYTIKDRMVNLTIM